MLAPVLVIFVGIGVVIASVLVGSALLTVFIYGLVIMIPILLYVGLHILWRRLLQ